MIICSGAPAGCDLAALARFRQDYPGYQPRRIDRAIRRGMRHLRSGQRADGSYLGLTGRYVFFQTAVLDYRSSKDIFPTRALAATATGV